MIISNNFMPVSFKSTFTVDASRVKKDNKKEMIWAFELAAAEHDLSVLNIVKDILNDGKDDKYKFVYTYTSQFEIPTVSLYKNDEFIVKEADNCCHERLTNKIWKDMAYNKLPADQKSIIKADFEKIKKQLIDSSEEKARYIEAYPDIFAYKINYAGIKRYEGSYNKSEGLSLHPGYLNEDIGLFKSGGYLTAPIDTPISTVGMHQCAALYIPDKANGKHFLWHVDSNTTAEKIAENIRINNLPTDKIWIASGCDMETEDTISNIIQAVESINENAKFAIISPSENEQEVIGYKGELFGSFETVKVSFDTPKTKFCL